MISLRIEFLAGSFHANPWDRGTNDGEVDWPPAPWRLLRALCAGWHRSGADDRAALCALLDRLTEPPMYLLPRASTGHTRHYMPLGSLKGGKPETTLVLDSFIALEKTADAFAAAYVFWPHVDLPQDQRTLLERCCSFIGYLGRAESWCSITVSDDVPANGESQLVDIASRSQLDGPTVRRLGAGPSLRGNGLLAALEETTAQMRKARRLVPAGTAWIEYQLPPDFLMVREQFRRRDRTLDVFGPLLLRFALERGTRTPKPAMKDAVVFGELLRAASIRHLSDQQGEPSPYRFAGKAEDGSKREGHDHPYFLPYDAEGRGQIDGIDVWLPGGCTHPEYRAVTSVTALWEHVVYDDRFPLTFIGPIERPRSAVWQTKTPVVLERFPKLRGTGATRHLVNSPREQIGNMLERVVGRPPDIELWPASRTIERERGGHIRIDAFRRTRLRKDSPPLPVAAATVRFDEPIDGPLVVGSLAHFGLGRFEPVT